MEVTGAYKYGQEPPRYEVERDTHPLTDPIDHVCTLEPLFDTDSSILLLCYTSPSKMQLQRTLLLALFGFCTASAVSRPPTYRCICNYC